MALIQMKNTFTVCPEGTHIFRIYKTDYDEEFGKLTVYLVNAQGITHQERYALKRADGSANDGACNAFSYLAKTALNDYTIEEVDPESLVDRYVKAEVTHTVVPSTKEDGKTLTFAHLGSKWVADGFDTTPTARALNLGKEPTITPAPVEQKTVGELDIDALLNG